MSKRQWLIANILLLIVTTAPFVMEYLETELAARAPMKTLVIPRSVKSMTVYEFFSLEPSQAIAALSQLKPAEVQKFKQSIQNAGPNSVDSLGLKKIGELLE